MKWDIFQHQMATKKKKTFNLRQNEEKKTTVLYGVLEYKKKLTLSNFITFGLI